MVCYGESIPVPITGRSFRHGPPQLPSGVCQAGICCRDCYNALGVLIFFFFFFFFFFSTRNLPWLGAILVLWLLHSLGRYRLRPVVGTERPLEESGDRPLH